MRVVFYSWTVLGGDPADVPMALGVTDDRRHAQEAGEKYLLPGGNALTAVIEEVMPAIAAHCFTPFYVRTGLAWRGSQSATGEVRWARVTDPEDHRAALAYLVTPRLPPRMPRQPRNPPLS